MVYGMIILQVRLSVWVSDDWLTDRLIDSFINWFIDNLISVL
jgi:hypothetical protein